MLFIVRMKSKFDLISERCNLIVNPADKRPAKGAHSKPIDKSDNAAAECNFVPYKILAQELQMESHLVASFDDQPVGGDKDDQAKNDAQ